MLYGYGQARTLPTPPLIRLRLNVSCSARRTAAAASKSKSKANTGAPMAIGTKETAPARRHCKPIEVWVTDEEKEAITERVKEAGMSRSGYLCP